MAFDISHIFCISVQRSEGHLRTKLSMMNIPNLCISFWGCPCCRTHTFTLPDSLSLSFTHLLCLSYTLAQSLELPPAIDWSRLYIIWQPRLISMTYTCPTPIRIHAHTHTQGKR